MDAEPAPLTVADVAKRLRLADPDRVYAWIASGELEAEDYSDKPGSTRPLWRITEEALARFRAGRRNVAREERPVKLPFKIKRYA